MKSITGIYGLLAMVFCTTTMFSQPTSIGFRAGYQHVLTSSSLSVFQGADDCGVFGNGNAPGFYAGFTGEYALMGDLLEVSAGIMASFRPAELQQPSADDFEVLDPQTNTYVPFRRMHVLSSSLGYIAFEIGLRSRPLPQYPFYVRAAFDAGNPLIGASYTQTEEITSPSSVLFPDGTKRRINGQGEFPGLGTSYGASGFIGAVFPFSGNWEVCPEIGFRYGLNSLTTVGDWRQNLVMAGVQVRYRMIDEVPPVLPPAEPDAPVAAVEPPVQPPPVVMTTVTTTPLEIRETVVTQTYPLLPYLFFDSESSAVRPRYLHTDDTTGFSERALPKKTLPIYYRVLDILGKRMHDRTKSTIVVTGTTDIREGGTPETKRKLAEARAGAVRDILVRRWGIPASRITVRTADKPTNPTSNSYEEGLEENRRVELSSADPVLLAPVVHTRFKEYIPVQPTHTFEVVTRNPAVAESWQLGVDRNRSLLATQGGQGAPPARITFRLDQEVTDRLGPIMGAEDTLMANLRVLQTSAADAVADTRFPVRKTVSNFEVSRLSLIVFDFDQYGITDINRDMMNRVVAGAAGTGSTAVIVGSTDRLGELNHNRELSTSRARAVEQHLRTSAPGVSITSVQGIGPSDLPYDNDLPEGRFYCRTVSLTITTPLREP